MSDEVLQFLCKLKEEGHDHCWQCKICSKAMKVMGQRVTKLEKAMVAVEKAVEDNTTKITDTQETVKGLQTKLNDVEKKSSEAVAGAAETAEDAVLRELDERQTKQCNLIIHNVKELDYDKTTIEDRKKADLSELASILETIGSNVEIRTGVKFTARLGKSGADGRENFRPMLVGLSSQQQCIDVLHAARNLAGTSLAHISIAPDLTKKQREKENMLRDEKDKLNRELSREEAGNWEWRLQGIKGHRRLVKVKRQRKRQRSQPGTSEDPADASPPRARIRSEVTN